MPSPFTSRIEPLEARIAPAAVFTYIDVDGDLVTIKTSKGTNVQLADIVVPFLSSEGVPNGQELQQIDFSMNAAVFKGTDLSVTAVRSNGAGDGRVNVGYIDATSPDDGASLDLGNVKISGDLGRIVAGDDTATTPGVKSLTVGTVGRYGTDTQAGGGNLNSTITGALPSLVVKGDFADGSLIVSNGMTPGAGKIGSILIGGSLIGTGTGFSGFISANGGIGTIKLGQNLEGGGGSGAGQISSGARIESVTIGGSILGGGGLHSGRLVATGFGKVLVKGSVVGSNVGGGMNQSFAGAIEATGGTISGSITILGSVLGGASRGSGLISILGDLGSLTIGGDLRSEGLESGTITSGNKIGSLTIGGSIIGGKSTDHGANIDLNRAGKIVIGGSVIGGEDAPFSANISAINRVDSVTIGGSLIGGTDSNLAVGGGTAGQSSGALDFLNAGKITIRGSVIGMSGDGGASIRGTFDSLSIRGSLVGGAGFVTGSIISSYALGPITIGGDIRGADALGFDVNYSGAILAKALTRVTVGGSIIAGHKITANAILHNGFIGAEDAIGAIVVKGSLVGNVDAQVGIVARGAAVPGATADVAIGSVTIGGRVERSLIAAGYSVDFLGQNADAQIGSVSVGGDWIASSLLAGINPFTDGKIGTADDRELLGGEDFGAGLVKDSNALTSKIASIVIKGGVFGTPGLTTDSFGFVAQEIVAFKIGGTVFPLKPGVANDVFASTSAQPIGAGRSSATPDGFEIHVLEV